eukprot:GHVR01115639.1.p1 GENE.GHVR01115639.1~~GHVR01115639.1.p1  ORF type:complete len:164 (+),score=3.01 GHVR01115639.1:150-641(+)
MGMQLVETIEVPSGGAASIEFTGIPQDGVDLAILLSARSDTTSQGVKVQPNGATTNLSSRILYGTGSSAGSSTDTVIAALTAQSTYTANTFGTSTIYFSNYTSSSAKSISTDSVNENNATLAFQYMVAGLWNNTAAITSVQLVPTSGNLVEHSTASLYKITAD